MSPFEGKKWDGSRTNLDREKVTSRERDDSEGVKRANRDGHEFDNGNETKARERGEALKFVVHDGTEKVDSQRCGFTQIWDREGVFGTGG
jgi:hypothetical protein